MRSKSIDSNVTTVVKGIVAKVIEKANFKFQQHRRMLSLLQLQLKETLKLMLSAVYMEEFLNAA